VLFDACLNLSMQHWTTSFSCNLFSFVFFCVELFESCEFCKEGRASVLWLFFLLFQLVDSFHVSLKLLCDRYSTSDQKSLLNKYAKLNELAPTDTDIPNYFYEIFQNCYRPVPHMRPDSANFSRYIAVHVSNLDDCYYCSYYYTNYNYYFILSLQTMKPNGTNWILW